MAVDDLEVENENLRARMVEVEDRREQDEWKKLEPVEMPGLVRPPRPKLRIETGTKQAYVESDEEL